MEGFHDATMREIAMGLVKYKDVCEEDLRLQGCSTLEELLTQRLGRDTGGWFGSTLPGEGTPLKGAWVLFSGLWDHTEDEWRERLRLGLPATCEVSMEFLDVGRDLKLRRGQFEMDVAKTRGKLFGVAPEGRFREQLRVGRVKEAR
jgi:hypothetical protein